MRRGFDYTAATPASRVQTLAAIRRLRCELDAVQTEVLAAIVAEQDHRTSPEIYKQWEREDVACALQIAPATARHELAVAAEISARFPGVLNAMWAAKVTGRMADRVVESCADLPEGAVAEVETRVLERAGAQTWSQFGQSLRRAVLAADPRGAEDRHTAARAQRRVVFTAIEHGMTELFALLPADHAAQLRAAVETLADTWAADPDDSRTADQRRADALTTLAQAYLTLDDTAGATDPPEGRGTDDVDAPHTPAPRRRGRPSTIVNVTVPLSVLLGLDERPGELDEHGTIPAGVARRLAFGPNTVWRRLLTDDHGNLVDASAATYRPPAAMTRYVQLRDRTCQFPGCQRRATRCELDHIEPWLHSSNTSPKNLICLCSRHHHLKHEAGWTLRRDHIGTHWTDRAKQTYTRPPPEPPPF